MRGFFRMIRILWLIFCFGLFAILLIAFTAPGNNNLDHIGRILPLIGFITFVIFSLWQFVKLIKNRQSVAA